MSKPSFQNRQLTPGHFGASGLLVALFALGAAFPVTAQTFQTESNWGMGLVVEPFAGAIEFHDDLFLDGTSLGGATAGLKLGRDVSFVGYYWRSTTDNLDRFTDLESYGGEVQLDIAFRSPVKPFLLAGGGRLNFRDEFVDTIASIGGGRGAENVLILGGGVAWDINRWLRITGTARDYLMDAHTPGVGPLPERDPSTTSSWMFTGGISLRLGGQPKQFGVVGGGPMGVAAGNAAMIPIPEEGEIRVTYGAAGAAGAANVLVTEDGDTIFLGGAGTTAAAVREMLRIELGYLDAIFPESISLEGGREPITGERADTLERRMAARFNEAFDFLMEVEADGVRLALDQQLAAEGVGEEAQERVLARADTVLDARLALMAEHAAAVGAVQDDARTLFERTVARRRFAAPYGGANFSGGGQFLIGGRLGLNTTWQRDRWGWVPEVALGFGSGGVSTLVQAGLHYHFPTTRSWEVYTGLGAGLLVLSAPIGDRDGASFVVTPTVGVSGESAEIAEGLGGAAWGWFAEYQAVGFFDLNRVLIGLKWAY